MTGQHPITELVLSKQESLSSIFTDYISKPREHNDQISKILKILQLNSSVSSDLVEEFNTFWRNHSKSQTFSDFLSVISGWVIENGMQSIPSIIIQTSYKGYLQKLSNYYKKILNDLNISDSLIIRAAFSEVSKYYQQFCKIYPRAQPKLIFRVNLLEKELEGLTFIFKFYAVQHLFLGKYPTFKKVSEEKQVWDLGTFLIFSKHFCVLKGRNKESKKNKEILTEVFKKHSFKGMNFKDFIEALDDLAVRSLSTNKPEFLKEIDEKDSKIFLYERLKIADLPYLKNKLKPFHKVFEKNIGHFRKTSETLSLKKNLRVVACPSSAYRSNVVSRNSSIGIITNPSILENLKPMPKPGKLFQIRNNLERPALTDRIRVYSEKCFKALSEKPKLKQ